MSQTLSRSIIWGTTPEERLLTFPCDRFIEEDFFDTVYYWGITINARSEVVFRWLCQLRVAPYSYDWIDNLGNQSQRTLTPGLDRLAIGQDVMGIFELTDFEPNRHLTIRMRPNSTESRIFGDFVGSYLIVCPTLLSCRLLVKLVVRYPTGSLGWFMRRFLPWGDIIMMRRQLLNFKKLCEQTS